MQNFVVGGRIRYLLSGESRAQWLALRASIEAKYAVQFQGAGMLARLWLWLKIRRELRREWAKMTPSPYATWLGTR